MAGNAPNAILAISSTDRYTKYAAGNANQPVSNVLLAEYINSEPFSNDFSITAPNALMNGYIEKIVISQIQLQYYVPTIVPGGNDYIVLLTISSSGTVNHYGIELPYGFFTPYELAAMLQVFLNSAVYADPREGYFTVTYNQGNIEAIDNIGFTVTLDDPASLRFSFPNVSQLINFGYPSTTITSVLKTYKTFGFTQNNDSAQATQFSWRAPTFLYTPYIDIYSDALTNYQKLKDTDSSVSKRKGLIARVYLSGVSGPQATSAANVYGAALGSEPFVLTVDLNTPKVINWTPDVAVNSLDFQQRDCYGDLLFSQVPPSVGIGGEVFNTEFQMTLLCIEGS